MKYFRYDEVVINNEPNRFWVVIHGNVLNLTPMLCDRRDSWNSNLQYLLSFGGKDISHFFDENHEPITQISPVTGKPRVLFPPICEMASSVFARTPCKLWSQDPKYHIGRITRRERQVRLINTLTGKTLYMKVCDEDTIGEIQRKYKAFYNHHAGSYLWRKFSRGGKCPGALRLDCTLDENGLIQEICSTGIEVPIPSIWLYYTDDFTVA